MMTYESKGGTGTASRRIEFGGDSFNVAALVQSNFGSRHSLMVCTTITAHAHTQHYKINVLTI